MMQNPTPPEEFLGKIKQILEKIIKAKKQRKKSRETKEKVRKDIIQKLSNPYIRFSNKHTVIPVLKEVKNNTNNNLANALSKTTLYNKGLDRSKNGVELVDFVLKKYLMQYSRLGKIIREKLKKEKDIAKNEDLSQKQEQIYMDALSDLKIWYIDVSTEVINFWLQFKKIFVDNPERFSYLQNVICKEDKIMLLMGRAFDYQQGAEITVEARYSIFAKWFFDENNHKAHLSFKKFRNIFSPLNKVKANDTFRYIFSSNVNFSSRPFPIIKRNNSICYNLTLLSHYGFYHIHKLEEEDTRTTKNLFKNLFYCVREDKDCKEVDLNNTLNLLNFYIPKYFMMMGDVFNHNIIPSVIQMCVKDKLCSDMGFKYFENNKGNKEVSSEFIMAYLLYHILIKNKIERMFSVISPLSNVVEFFHSLTNIDTCRQYQYPCCDKLQEFQKLKALEGLFEKVFSSVKPHASTLEALYESLKVEFNNPSFELIKFSTLLKELSKVYSTIEKIIGDKKSNFLIALQSFFDDALSSAKNIDDMSCITTVINNFFGVARYEENILGISYSAFNSANRDKIEKMLLANLEKEFSKLEGKPSDIAVIASTMEKVQNIMSNIGLNATEGKVRQLLEQQLENTLTSILQNTNEFEELKKIFTLLQQKSPLGTANNFLKKITEKHKSNSKLQALAKLNDTLYQLMAKAENYIKQLRDLENGKPEEILANSRIIFILDQILVTLYIEYSSARCLNPSLTFDEFVRQKGLNPSFIKCIYNNQKNIQICSDTLKKIAELTGMKVLNIRDIDAIEKGVKEYMENMNECCKCGEPSIVPLCKIFASDVFKVCCPATGFEKCKDTGTTAILCYNQDKQCPPEDLFLDCHLDCEVSDCKVLCRKLKEYLILWPGIIDYIIRNSVGFCSRKEEFIRTNYGANLDCSRCDFRKCPEINFTNMVNIENQCKTLARPESYEQVRYNPDLKKELEQRFVENFNFDIKCSPQ